MLFFAFPSHQHPGLWRSVRPHAVLNTSLKTHWGRIGNHSRPGRNRRRKEAMKSQ
ncbi:hypothetical protein DPMN_020996 [Dreissena polymorpha]|uniref:Uncharacterized protein n=1 Tax=Dreissena polymorpha TaxID=45954 RepID=A0A9D4NM05_DREPO|nr:hypothetical protein DPMN_020996 [Dreissena polymorpha]